MSEQIYQPYDAAGNKYGELNPSPPHTPQEPCPTCKAKGYLKMLNGTLNSRCEACNGTGHKPAQPIEQTRAAECLCGQSNDGLPRMDIVCPVHDPHAPLTPEANGELEDIVHQIWNAGFTIGHTGSDYDIWHKGALEVYPPALLAWRDSEVAAVLERVKAKHSDECGAVNDENLDRCNLLRELDAEIKRLT